MPKARRDRNYHDNMLRTIGFHDRAYEKPPEETPYGTIESSRSFAADLPHFSGRKAVVQRSSINHSSLQRPAPYINPERITLQSPSPKRAFGSPSTNAHAPTNYNVAVVKTRCGIRIVKNNLTLSEQEIDYYEPIDTSLPLTENIQSCLHKDGIDLGMCGLVLLKYQKCNRLDSETYQRAVRLYSTYDFPVLPTVSMLGVLSPVVYQLSQAFMTNLMAFERSQARKKQESASQILWKPTFSHVDVFFKGTHPFKAKQLVSMRFLGTVPSDTQRAVSWIIRNTLAQIIVTPDAHQQYAVRMNRAKNAKTKWQDLPFDVAKFLEDYCLQSFGYPPAIRSPGYTYQMLADEHPELASRLGNNREECSSRFIHLVQDVDTFQSMVFDKMQRTFNDLRQFVLHRDIHVVDGAEYVKTEFVRANKHDQPIVNAKQEPDHRMQSQGSQFLQKSMTPELEDDVQS